MLGMSPLWEIARWVDVVGHLKPNKLRRALCGLRGTGILPLFHSPADFEGEPGYAGKPFQVHLRALLATEKNFRPMGELLRNVDSSLRGGSLYYGTRTTLKWARAALMASRVVTWPLRTIPATLSDGDQTVIAQRRESIRTQCSARPA
jgi:hypothetical protein